MQVTVFGASGKVGRLTVPLLQSAGHTVTVFVHRSAPFDESETLSIVRGDIHNAEDVAQAIKGSQAVISTLGSWGTKQKDILGTTMESLVPAMETATIPRLITLTGSGANAPGDRQTAAGKLTHALFGLVAGKILRDGEKHLRILADSNLEWTSLRSGVMRSGEAAGYRLDGKLPKALESITRQTIAQALVDQLTDRNHLRQAPHIHAA